MNAPSTICSRTRTRGPDFRTISPPLSARRAKLREHTHWLWNPSGQPNGKALRSPGRRLGMSMWWKLRRCSTRWSRRVKPLSPTRLQRGTVHGNSGVPMPWTVDWWRWRSARRVKFAEDVQPAISHVQDLGLELVLICLNVCSSHGIA